MKMLTGAVVDISQHESGEHKKVTDHHRPGSEQGVDGKNRKRKQPAPAVKEDNRQGSEKTGCSERVKFFQGEVNLVTAS